MGLIAAFGVESIQGRAMPSRETSLPQPCVCCTAGRQVQSYRDQVQLYRDQVQLYRDQVQLYRDLVQLYRDQVQLYRDQVQLYRDQVQLYRHLVQLYRDTDDPYDAVKVLCNNEHCKGGCWMHKDCFNEFEQSVLSYLRSCGRARSWSEKQRLQNLQIMGLIAAFGVESILGRAMPVT